MLQEEKIHFNINFLQNEARNLAQRQSKTLKSKTLEPIAPLLDRSRDILTQAYRELAYAAKQKKELSSAAEWLIDNFYIIQEQIVQLKEDLPRSYYKKLPRLKAGKFMGLPRIYELVDVLATISDNIIDQDNTTIAVQSYQEIETLKLGELWAVPIMIRLVLLIRLRDRVKELLQYRKVRLRVDQRLESLMEEESDEPGLVLRKLHDLITDEDNDKVFLCVLAQRMQVQGILTDPERSWFDFKFRSWRTSLEEELRYEAQRTSRLHLSIQNAISSIREVSESDWTDFVETCSVVERILRLDPSGYYPNMDFQSRDWYRKVIEKLSIHSSLTEPETAEKALLLAEEATQKEQIEHNKENHIGFYLIGEGFSLLADETNYRMPIGERMRKRTQKHPAFYFIFVMLHLCLLLGIVAYLTDLLQLQGWIIATTFAAAFFPALELSVVSTNRILSLLLSPRMLPKLKISGDVRDDLRTLVVVPTLFTSASDVKKQFEALEIRALANPNNSLQFALLSDFTDAEKQTMPTDQKLIKTAIHAVKQLNKKYSSKYGDKFYLLHRERCWNEKQQCWMGWERKRGKLEELNKLLRNTSEDTTYTKISGDFISSIKSIPVRYVITLDSDTQLPPGSALKLISTAAHPLNKAEISSRGDCIYRGYGIFQPRISITPKSAMQSRFTKIFSGNVGIDPYTSAVSDIYQDLFGEGIFTGKGLYDVEVFDKLLGNRFPDNTILSHDLLESTYLRAALVTDIELFDDYPSNYLNYSKRNHRWIRGDWQILYWLFGKVPAQEGIKAPNPAGLVSKWKIFDNLRRSLNPLFLLVFLLSGWFLLPGSALIWTAAAMGILAFPIYSSFTTEIFRRPARVRWKLYLEKIRSNFKTDTIHSINLILFMPHQAYLSLDAILRTLWRMFVSHENLLEWTSASLIEKKSNVTIKQYWENMWFNIVWAFVCIALVWLFDPVILLLALPFATAWCAAPVIAFILGKRYSTPKYEFTPEEVRELKLYARRTWHFFEKHVNEEHSWLPPDNYQEEPYIGATARTSPTNMGLALAATCSAYEFGYLTTSELIDRLGNMLGSMKLLDKYEGHFFNWYSTKLGDVLKPRYLSTVDSGNLAASLLVVKQALLSLGDRRWPSPIFWEGLRETVWVLKELLSNLEVSGSNAETLREELMRLVEIFEEELPLDSPANIEGWLQELNKSKDFAAKISGTNLELFHNVLDDVQFENLSDWFRMPLKQIQTQINEIEAFDSKELDANNSLNELQAYHTSLNWLKRAEELSHWCHDLVQEMNFSMLYFKERDLFSIGYNLDRASLDKSTYDQLATEARLASYIAIAKGEVPPKHWFRLSRRLTSIDRNEILISWGGTMFEYLMPVLFMLHTEETLLSNTYENVVVWQKNYGERRKRPWGFSESGYGVLNLDLHYQYRAFGAPGLGLRRGLAEDYVVSPYASMLALMIQPKISFANLTELKKQGAYGLNGFYEAVDYSSSSGDPEVEKTIVQMYMAHHQGMILLALSNILNNNIIQRLFHSDPIIRSCEVLLQERVPRGIPIKEPRPIDVELEPGEEQKVETIVDHAGQKALDDSPPRTHILSNGEYTSFITHAGTGYSKCEGLMLSRWRPDRVRDPYGFFLYVKDLADNSHWSVGHQPVGRKADRYDSWYHTGKVQIARVDNWIESFMEVCVSPDDNIELRKLTLTNYSQQPRQLEITSYAEVVLNKAETDKAHPAFSNLFLQTDYIAEHHALIAKRRPRSDEERPVWLVHTLASDDLEHLPAPLQFETDRAKFIGRGRSLKNPAAMDEGSSLSGSIGNVPDPIVSMRRTVELQPGENKSITFGLGKVNSWEEAIKMADRYDNPYATDRVFELATIYGRVELEHIGISGERAHYFQKLASALIYGNERLRAEEGILLQNRRTQSGLWAYGISGDIPILVCHIKNNEHLKTVDALLKGHALWRLKGFDADLVFVNDHPTTYINEIQDAIQSKIQASTERQMLNQKGGIFLIRSDNIPKEDLILLNTVASVVIYGKLPKLNFKNTDQNAEESVPLHYHPIELYKAPQEAAEEAELLFYNGYGGFSKDGTEYIVHLKRDEATHGKTLIYPPAPWINVLANEKFGCITSESGSDYTWSENSRENRITPWSNDTVTDPPGDAIYIRDEELKKFWSPTPAPVPGSAHYEVRHGHGYTSYASRVSEIDQLVTRWVPSAYPVKVTRVRLSNTSLIARKISVFRYLEWVLGIQREDAAPFIVTDYDPVLKAITAQNFYNNEFAGRVAFALQFSSKEMEMEEVTTDRQYFIGRNNDLSNPRAVSQIEKLNDRFGAGFDPCAAFQSTFTIDSGESVDLYYLTGETATRKEAEELVQRYRNVSELESSLQEIKKFWQQKLGVIRVNTPVPEINIMMNGWLQYQNIACRLWARSGFYQSGGAYGFRDQLQDAAAAIYLDSDLTRKQILLHAAHQFPEGDVLHWWHPPTDRGTRTRITDDLLWLPYVTALYVHRTGDTKILTEQVPFITARLLEESEQEAYLQPEISHKSDSLYEHCCLAIDRSLTMGANGIPLMGAGDWNDSMNQIGEKGKGESVWLGFFLYKILSDFIPLCKKQSDQQRVKDYQSFRRKLKGNLNKQGWDGNWYRRAFYDDGTPVGSSQSKECQIDAIAQSWSVISKVAPIDKATMALEAADQYLVSEQEGMIRLLTPPFDKTPNNPGYIKGYIPGVRENGGQYTHGALWLVRAFAEMGYIEHTEKLIKMLIPINHSKSPEDADRYRVEPYAVAADIYGEPPLTGVGGWTWYTGSAGWMYRVILESILGFEIQNGNKLTVNPNIPSHWKEFTITLKDKDGKTRYRLNIKTSKKLKKGVLSGLIDGQSIKPGKNGVLLKMKEDREVHNVEIRMGLSEQD